MTVSTDDGSGAVTVWQESVGPGGVSPSLANGIQCPPNASVTATLAAAGAGNAGAVNLILEAE